MNFTNRIMNIDKDDQNIADVTFQANLPPLERVEDLSNPVNFPSSFGDDFDFLTNYTINISISEEKELLTRLSKDQSDLFSTQNATAENQVDQIIDLFNKTKNKRRKVQSEISLFEESNTSISNEELEQNIEYTRGRAEYDDTITKMIIELANKYDSFK